jgi:Flp pilus assembly protein TadD
LDPKYPTARHWYSLSLKVKRQFDDSLREIKVAQELDPLSSVIGHNVGVAYFLKGDFGSAEQQFRKVIELDPAFPLAHQYLGWTHIKQGRIEEGTAEIQKAVQLSGNSSRPQAELGYCYAIGGRRNDALQVISELELKYKAKEATAVSMSVIYAGLGDKDQAFAWLEKAFEERNGELSDITWRPVFDTLRDDPRYTDLVRRMKLDI